MKTFLTQLSLKKMQIKTTTKYHYTPTRMRKIKKRKSKYHWGYRDTVTHMLLVGMQNDIATLENRLAVSCKCTHALNIKPSNTWLGIYPRDIKTYVHFKICSKAFIIALFLISNWEEPKRPASSEYINHKLWCI